MIDKHLIKGAVMLVRKNQDSLFFACKNIVYTIKYLTSDPLFFLLLHGRFIHSSLTLFGAEVHCAMNGINIGQIILMISNI